ncbi:hypothetical protein [Cellulomonas palmilytica]|uniref:hypothetical protein n=1 Tax=Cellulomonas palmilytica TaxID=2608402 RepID=UPI001F3CF216|nr:hypothetical protein [Cellulomonas palmilytica]UJP39355.1 hypothetical protein F1D97_13570 [Cellulomonas palmilytica]
MRHLTTCDECGARIALVLVVPEHPRKSKKRSYIPLDLDYNDALSPVPPSHALSTGRTTCRPLTVDHPIAPHEFPALTHFATCPARQSPVSAARAVPRPRRLAAVLLQRERTSTSRPLEIHPDGSTTRVRPAATLASAAALAHSAATYWRLDDPDLSADYALAAELLEDRYARVWHRTPV